MSELHSRSSSARIRSLNSRPEFQAKRLVGLRARVCSDVSGKRFGRLVALEPTEKRSGHKVVWRCQCDCGNECLVAVNHLNDGRRVSCGCAKLGNRRAEKHGHYGSPTWRSWSSMKTRCGNRNVKEFQRYGGRGIKVCDRWEYLDNFLQDMGDRPSGRTLDRIDNDGNYEPGNCRWATWSQQRINQRSTERRREAQRKTILVRERDGVGRLLPRRPKILGEA
jgi:hypothetical protein